MKTDRSHWVKKDQIDTPLCNVFANTITNGTARQYAKFCERILDKKHRDLDTMGYVAMNKYLDKLSAAMDALAGKQLNRRIRHE